MIRHSPAWMLRNFLHEATASNSTPELKLARVTKDNASPEGDYKMYLNESPEITADTITLFDSGGLSPNPKWLLNEPTVEIFVSTKARTEDGLNAYAAGYNLINFIRECLCNVHPEYMNALVWRKQGIPGIDDTSEKISYPNREVIGNTSYNRNIQGIQDIDWITLVVPLGDINYLGPNETSRESAMNKTEQFTLNIQLAVEPRYAGSRLPL